MQLKCNMVMAMGVPENALDKNVIVVSIYGEKNGGVPQVAFYQKQALSNDYNVKLLKAKYSLGKLNLLIYPFFFSVLLHFLPKKIVISQCFNAFLYKSDYIVAHGTQAGYMDKIPENLTLGGRLVAFMERIAARRSKRILAVCNRVGEECVRYYKIPKNKIIVLNNCVNTDIFFPFKDKEKNKELRLLFVGNIAYGKGLDRLLELAKYIETQDNVRLYIATSYKGEEQLFSHLSKTVIKKSLDMTEMNKLYNHCDVMYFPTRYEGFSMASLEALSTGMPIIGSEYAVPEEFGKYEFAFRTSDYSPIYILEKARNFKQQYANKRNEIHKIISQDFSYSKYRENLISMIKNGDIN